MFLVVRPLLFAACLRVLPTAIFSSSSDATLPTNTAPKNGGRQMLARMVFSWTFTEASLLFVLLLCQATDTLSAPQRAAHFQFSLYALLAIHTILIPQSIALLVLSSAPAVLRSVPRAIFASCIPVLLSLILLSYIPPFTVESDPPFLSRTLSRLVVLGTTILGLLSGFGAVTRAWDFLPSSSTTSKNHDAVPTEEDIRSTEAGLQSVLKDLQTREDELASRPLDDTAGISNHAAVWVKRVGDTLRGGDDGTSFTPPRVYIYILPSDIANQRSKGPPFNALLHPPVPTHPTRLLTTCQDAQGPTLLFDRSFLCRLLYLSDIHRRV